jgi:hypothetical protein
MPKVRPDSSYSPDDHSPHRSPDLGFPATKKRKPVPHEFVLEALAAVSPETRPMFGCLAVYVGEKIVGVLRERPTAAADNGFWLATTREHHASLRADFPSLRSIEVLGEDVTGWQILPADAPDFEEAAMRACDLIIARDPRIGKLPKPRKLSKRNFQNSGAGPAQPSNPAQPKKTKRKKTKGRSR